MISFGLISFSNNIRIASTARLHSANLSGLAAGVDELYGNERPIASIAIAIVLAVYKPPQAPYKKFKGFYTQGRDGGNFFTGIATDEVFLIRAECNARLDRKEAALADLKVRRLLSETQKWRATSAGRR